MDYGLFVARNDPIRSVDILPLLGVYLAVFCTPCGYFFSYSEVQHAIDRGCN